MELIVTEKNDAAQQIARLSACSRVARRSWMGLAARWSAASTVLARKRKPRRRKFKGKKGARKGTAKAKK